MQYAIPDKIAIQYRQLARHRNKIMRIRTKLKTFIHGVTLQQGIKIKAKPFSLAHIAALKELGDYRINSYLEMIEFQTRQIYRADKMIKDTVSQNSQMKLLTPHTRRWSVYCTNSTSRDCRCEKICWFTQSVRICRNSRQLETLLILSIMATLQKEEIDVKMDTIATLKSYESQVAF